MNQANTYSRSFFAMASQCELVIGGVDKSVAEKWMDSAVEEIARIERKYSRYKPDSLISKINASAGIEAVECDEEFFLLFDYADKLYQVSNGLFDITSGILRKAWNFQQAVLPSKEQLAPLLDLIGWEKVERNNNYVRLPNLGMEIDFGGFGKEYAADRAASVLIAGGINSGYVNMAGDIRVLGPKVDGSSWQMGIQHPRSHGTIIATIPLTQGALATSGDYERFIEVGGKRYCHVLNPDTGYPANYWQSVSVLAPLAIMAGSFTTIAMLKEQDAIPFLEESGVAYMAIDQHGNIHNKSHGKRADQLDPG